MRVFDPLKCPPPEDLFAVSASPGFTWGKSGPIQDAYLLNDTVPSNQSGRLVPVDGTITTVFISSTAISSGSIDIRKRTGPTTFSILTTVTMPSVRTLTQLLAVPPSVFKNDELAAYVNGVVMTNVVVGVIIKGTL